MQCMALLLAIIALCAPRFVILGLWFFSNWFVGVFETKLWPVLGFIFVPLTLLWYSVVINWYAGEWNWWRIAILVIAIVCDLSSEKKATRRRN